MQFEQLLRQSLIWRGFYFIVIVTLNIVLSRYLQATGTGWVYFLTNLFSISSLLGSCNLESGFTYFAANGQMNYRSLAWFGVLFTFLISWLIAPALTIYFTHFPVKAVSLQQAVTYGQYYTLGIVLANLFSVLFYVQKNFIAPNICLCLCNSVLIGAILYLQHTGVPAEKVIYTYFLFFTIQGVAIMLLFLFQHDCFRAFSLPRLAELKLLFRYSLIALMANFIFLMVYRIDFWFVEHYRSASELGNYIQASKLGQMLLIVPQILASVVFPQVSEGLENRNIQQQIVVITRLLMQFFILLLIGSMLLGKLLFSAVFGITFNTMHLPFTLLLPGIFALSVLTLFSAYFAGSNKISVNVIGACLALVFVGIGNYYFTPHYGIVAAAIISTIGYSINLMYSIYVFILANPHFAFKDFFRWQVSDYQLIKKMGKG